MLLQSDMYAVARMIIRHRTRVAGTWATASEAASRQAHDELSLRADPTAWSTLIPHRHTHRHRGVSDLR